MKKTLSLLALSLLLPVGAVYALDSKLDNCTKAANKLTDPVARKKSIDNCMAPAASKPTIKNKISVSKDG